MHSSRLFHALPPALVTALQRLERLAGAIVAPFAGFCLLVLGWQMIALHNPAVPTPLDIFQAFVQELSNAFPERSGNGSGDDGLGWTLLVTFERLTRGFLLALAISLPLGFLLGRHPMLCTLCQPIMNVFRHVSPLAWVPFGLLVFDDPEAAALWTIFICASWPMTANTAEALRRVPADYMTLARLLDLPERKVMLRILLPAALPQLVTGMRQGLNTAWIVIVAAELFINARGIGSWLRAALDDMNSGRVLLAIWMVGILGLLIDLPLMLLRRRVAAWRHVR